MKNKLGKVLFVLAFCPMLFIVSVYFINPFNTGSYDPRLRILGISPYRVASSAMAQSYQSGEIVLASLWEYSAHQPQINDVILYIAPGDMSGVPYMSRIIGQGGDSIQMIEGKLYRNDKMVKEAFVQTENFNDPISNTTRRYWVPKNHFFLAGDNRDNSMDSRHMGFVPAENIFAKIKAKLPKNIASNPQTQP